MNEWYVTFGSRFARDRPARELGAAWAFLYHPDDFQARYFPRGEIGRFR